MKKSVKRFDRKETYAGREVKRTVVRHARTENKGRETRSMKPLKGGVR